VDHEFLFFWNGDKFRYLLMSNDHEFHVWVVTSATSSGVPYPRV
jgi:hypothetical protein